MSSIFTKIIRNEIPSYKILENQKYCAFLDIAPMVKGHTLVVPKKEVDDMFDLDGETLAGLQVFAKKVAHAIKKTFPCNRVGMAVVGLEVPHAHLHLIPIDSVKDMNFTKPKVKMTAQELTDVAEKIKANMNAH